MRMRRFRRSINSKQQEEDHEIGGGVRMSWEEDEDNDEH
jgi:hypothetical protein